MASVYTNDLRLEEIGSGEQSGSWGDTTNTNLELIAEAFAFGTEAITTNADTHTTTIADGASDPGRALFLKYTGTLDSACTITIGPNTVSKLWFIENGTSGSQNIIISQGSGANITIPAGQTKAVYSNGGGSGAVMVDAFATLNVVDLLVDDALTVTGATTTTGTLTVGVDDTGYDVKFFGDTASAYMLWDASADDLILGGAAGLSVNSAALVTGVLTTTAATVFNGGFAANAASTITTSSTDTPLSLVYTGAAANVGPVLDLYRNSASPADNDVVGNINYKAENSAGEIITYVRLLGFLGDVTDGTEDGEIYIQRMVAGTSSSVLSFTSSETIFNDDSKDLDFRVESNGDANMLFVDGGRDKVFIGASGSDNDAVLLVQGDDVLHPVIKAAGASANGFTMFSDNYAVDESLSTFGIAYSSANLVLARGVKVSGSADNTYLSSQDTGAMQPAAIRLSNGTMQFLSAASSTTVATDSAVTMVERLSVSPTETVVNDTGVNMDFRVESDGNAKLFFCDGGTNRVGFGNDAPTASVHLRDVYDSSGADVFFKAQNGIASRQAGYLVDDENSATVAYLFYDNGSDIVSIGTNAAKEVQIRQAGTERITLKTGGATVINESGADLDFRVESASNDHALFVDASTNQVIFGYSSATTSAFYFALGSADDKYAYFANNSGTAGNPVMFMNRQGSDGNLIDFRQANGLEGSISVSGSTVSYNGFSGRHESSGIPANTPVGTVVSTIDALDVYPETQNDPEGGVEPNPKAGQTRADHAQVEVSTSTGDPCVYGVVSEFDGSGKLIVTSVGIGSVRVTGACSKGDLLESNGDGTAKAQSDDIVRSKTIGKVTIGNSDTGVKLVSCVMYCG